ncbi:MAG: HD domain-containing protein [Candidatus Competibacter sp.]
MIKGRLSSSIVEESIIDELDKWLKVNTEKKSYTILLDLIENINQIWTFDIVVQNYTTHKLDHSLMVLYYAINLIKNYKIKLDKTANFIIAVACLLHDIGLQCRDESIYDEVRKKINYCGNESLNIFVRNNHALISSLWIRNLYNNESYLDLGLRYTIKKIPEEIISIISLAVNSHSGHSFFEKTKGYTYTHAQIAHPINKLALIVRLADELDIGKSRGDLANPILNNLPTESASYFWRHYCTLIKFHTYGIININVEIHPDDTNKEPLLKYFIYDKFIEKNSSIITAFREFFQAPLIFDYSLSFNEYKKSIPFKIYDYLSSKLLELDQNKINYSFAKNIIDVYNLDTILLEPLYTGDVDYAINQEQAELFWKKNPNMTFCAYKSNTLIGYLTCIPVYIDVLTELLNFNITENQLKVDDIITYDGPKTVTWYISGLGVEFCERLHSNYPSIVYSLIEKALDFAKTELRPRGVKISHIGAIAYTDTAKKLCDNSKTFNGNKFSDAYYTINGIRPSSYFSEVNLVKAGYFLEFTQ